MDELEFRRQAMSDPKQKSSEFLKALSCNEANHHFLDEIRQLDKQISDAMQVDIPEGLADRILFTQSSHANKQAKASFVRKTMAMAASVAFILGLLVGQLNWGNLLIPNAQASLVDIAIKHVENEEAFISQLDEQANSQQINAKMQPFAYKFTQSFPYHVYYLNHCGFGQSSALHMVFQGESGKVTLFFAAIATNTNHYFNKEGMTGVIQSIDDKSLILVGNNGENMQKIAERLLPQIISTK